MSKGLKKVWSVFTTLIVIAAVILAMLLVGARLVGLRVYTVLSGSMEPTYQTGSLIYVKKTDPFQLETGDVITFMLDENTLATHRIAGIVQDEEDPSVIRFRTKGDANEFEDGSLVHYKNVVGVPVFTIPKLGYLANYIQQPPGLYVTIAVGAFLLLLMFMPELVSAIKGDDEQKEEKPKKEKKASAEDSKLKKSSNPAPVKTAPQETDEEIQESRKHSHAATAHRGTTHPKGRHEAK